MNKAKYFGDKLAPDYFTPSPTAPTSGDTAPVAPAAPAASTSSVIDEAVKTYSQSGHRLVVKRYAVKRS